MPTLEELLRSSLTGANEKFNQANSDLHTIVAETAKAVQAVTEGNADLRLVQMGSDENSTRYDLVVVTKGDQFRKLAGLVIRKDGYPITSSLQIGDQPNKPLDSSERLSAYFQTLASDPNSPLVAYLAYIIRNSPKE